MCINFDYVSAMLLCCSRTKLFCLIFYCLCNIPLNSQTSEIYPPKITERYYQIIEAPNLADQWDSWRQEISAWKDSVLKKMAYNGEIYQKKEYQWASKAYSTLFLMANDKNLYDKNGKYDIGKYLKKYEEQYGGVDVVVLWPTYPQLGFDDRDQYFFYRNLPGGIQGLKTLCDQLHRMGKKLVIAYNPWDNIARLNGKNDIDELLNLLRETGADGFFLDTISNFENLFQQLKEINPAAVFQSEIPINPEALNQVHQSWLEPAWSRYHALEFSEVPGIVRNRWLEQRHMIYRLSRFSHEQSTLIQNAWINGCGIVIWENVFGTVNELNPRDRTLLNAMLPIQRQYSEFFTQGAWTPLFPVWLHRVYASQWQLGLKKIWTIVNRQEQMATGAIFAVDFKEGMKYYDLIAGKELKTTTSNAKTSLFTELKPKAIGCILAIPSNELNAEFYTFLAQQAVREKKSNFNTAYSLPPHRLKPFNPTPLYAKNKIPRGMVNIPVPLHPVELNFTFRQRECGFYPMDGIVDFSYSRAINQVLSSTIKVNLKPYAMDEALVTNAQFEQFLLQSKYKPYYPENFLNHWINNKIPFGQEDHPVTWIGPDDARAYARWAGKRLPTEAEWQWAAQNGTEQTIYPWGNQYDSTNCNGGQHSGTTTIKQFENGKTKSGLYDMSGNVWQWTESERTDGYNTYSILRGGGWYVNKASHWYADQGPQKTSFGAKYLLTYPGLDRCGTVGFRCVADVQK